MKIKQMHTMFVRQVGFILYQSVNSLQFIFALVILEDR